MFCRKAVAVAFLQQREEGETGAEPLNLREPQNFDWPLTFI
jgi:hypothetical protein